MPYLLFKRFFLTIVPVLLVVAACNAQKGNKKNKMNDLIDASQSGASPLFFEPTNDVPLVTPGTFYNEEECIVRKGLPNFFSKVKAGKQVIIAFIGGSITQGDLRYRPQIAKYIQSRFSSNTTFKWMNAGVSGTGTDLGSFRIEEQVLQHNPDLVFVEFAVNGAYKPGMEGIVRKIIRNNPDTDICLIYTIREGQTAAYQRGVVPANIKGLDSIASHYQLPSVHLGMEPAALEKENKLIWKGKSNTDSSRILFTIDGIHPLPAGGNIYAAALARAINKMENITTPFAHRLPGPLVTGSWDDAHMYDPLKIIKFDKDWQVLQSAGDEHLNKFTNWFPHIVSGSKPGASFSFKFKGDMFGIFDVGGPEAGQLEFIVDGKPLKLQVARTGGFRYYQEDDAAGAPALNRFNAQCNNRYRGQHDVVKISPGVHDVTIRISSIKANKKEILSPDSRKDINLHPEKYDQTVIYIGRILLRGELL